jgi:L-threonate 2-dehydrogenase
MNAAPAAGPVGLIGLGAMGGAFARTLLERGFAVVGCDPVAARAADLRRLGGTVLTAPATVREASATVVTSLPSAAALDAVVAGPGGLLEAVGGATVVVETSTLALADKLAARNRLRAVGVEALDCPVSGSAEQAARGDVVVLASGDAAQVEALGPVLRGLGRGCHFVGPFGAGTRVKLIANQLVTIHTAAAAEAMRAVEAGGVDADAAVAALTDGAGSSRMLKLRAARMLRRDYDSPTSLRILLKDLDLIDADLAASGTAAPLYEISGEQLRRAAALGYGDADPAAVFEVPPEPQAGSGE